MTTKKLKALFGVTPGVKTLLTVGSFAATIVGWAWLTGQGAGAAQAANTTTTNHTQALGNTAPSTTPNQNTTPSTTTPNHRQNNNGQFFQQNQSLFAPFTLRGMTQSSR
jgi:hypothetical protein